MYCVIVGDIIKSREIEDDARAETMRRVKEVLERVNAHQRGIIMADFGLVRGDAFEGVLLTQICAAEITRTLIREIYRINGTLIRISSVFGELQTRVNDRNEANGPAFYKASADIDRMKAVKKSGLLQVSFDTDSVARPVVDSLLGLINAVFSGWTERQREIAFLMEEHGGSRRRVTDELGISAQAVGKQLQSMSYSAYDAAWRSLDALVVELDEAAISGAPARRDNFLTYFGLAERQFRLDNYKSAASLLQRALELCRTELGENSPELVNIYIRLAECSLELNARREARELAEAALEISRQGPEPGKNTKEILQKLREAGGGIE